MMACLGRLDGLKAGYNREDYHSTEGMSDYILLECLSFSPCFEYLAWYVQVGLSCTQQSIHERHSKSGRNN